MVSLMKTLKNGVSMGLSLGIIVGLILGFYLLTVNFHMSFLFFFSFLILISLYYSLIYIVFSSGISLVLYLFERLTGKKIRKNPKFLLVLTSLISISLLFKERHIFLLIPFDFMSFGWIISTLGIFVVFFGFSYLIARGLLYLKKSKLAILFKERKKISIVAVFLFMFIAYWIIILVSSPSYPYDPNPEVIPYNTNEKVVFIGVDALTKEIFDPLLQQGKLPNYQKLIESGSYTNTFKTESPTKSPIVWTVISTGKNRKKNGVTDFYKIKLFYSDETINALIDGITLRNLFAKLESLGFSETYNLGTKDRYAKAIWDILSEYGKSVTVLGHFSTWPAEPVNGILTVFDLGAFKKKSKKESYSKEKIVYPESMLKEFDEHNLIMGHYEVDVKKASDFINEEYIKDDNFRFHRIFRQVLASDRTNINIANYLLDQGNQTDYFFLYIEGTDAFQHLFWRHKDPEHFYPSIFSLVFNPDRFERPSKNDIQIYKDTIEKYYIYTDKVIGEILKKLDENTTIIVASDHGQRYAHHMYPFPGILIMSGKNINKGKKISDASLYDLTPTILYLLGFPVAEDMDGKVLTEAIDPEFLAHYPLKFISTYETEPIEDRLGSSSKKQDLKTQEEMDKLNSLGYIN